MSDPVGYDVRDGVAYVTLARPDAMNAADAPVRHALAAAFARAAADADARAVVVTGAGEKAFCVGQDLNELRPLYESGDPQFRSIVTEYNAAITALVEVGKPTVAAINGAAAGAGMSLACACDFRIAASGVRLTTAFSKIGLVPDTGMSWTLPRLVGTAKALELLLLSEPVTAEEAHALGLVTRVVDRAAFVDEVHAFAAALAAGPTLAYGWISSMVRAATTSSLADALAAEEERQNAAGLTHDHQSAVRAFLAKQPPVFEGR
jgi:2-(1,2-epoxy-1,2-dihydrophenyl)acetyl-CoA isomerase